MNLAAGRDIFDDMDDAEKTGGFGAKVHIRIQQRNGRKSIWYDRIHIVLYKKHLYNYSLYIFSIFYMIFLKLHI